LALIAALVYIARVLKKYNNNRANIAQGRKITTHAYSELEGVTWWQAGIQNELPERNLTRRAQM
jgi:hypothetical protein